MRVAVNAAIYDRRPSGLGVYARELVRALRTIHADLIVYTSRPDEMPEARPIPAWGEPSRGGTGHLWRLLWTQTGLPRRVRRDRADVLLNVLPEGPLRLRLPQVSVVHDLIPLFYPDEFPRRQWYFRRFVPAVLRASAVVVADSTQTRQDILERYRLPPELVTVVLPGVDHGRFFPHSDASAVAARYGLGDYILSVGNVRPHKNLARLIEAFAELPADLTLVIVGYPDPRYTPEIFRRAADLGVQQRVKVLGFVPSDELPRLYSAARATAVPSLYEGFGLPVLEAMACGSPVVASTTGGLQEAAGDAALLVDPLDVPGLARALGRAITETGLRASLRERGRAHASRFRWEETARLMSRVIHTAASRSPRH